MEKSEQELIPYIHKTEFPKFMTKRLADLKISGLYIKDHGAPGLSLMDTSVITYELSKIDASIATFFLVHNSIGLMNFHYLGSEEQRARLLPEAIRMEKICSFGLTEPDFGSDATSLKTFARKVKGGYVLNGHKRWIGNAGEKGYITVWARNEDEGGKIQGFVVDTTSKGYTPRKIENKMSLPMVQNQDILI